MDRRPLLLAVLFVCLFKGSESEDLIKFVQGVGYHLTEHEIETNPDKYLLGYHRLQKTVNASVGLPVLLQHGLAMSSAAFLTPGKDALAYLLIDTGFDVWLANSRGNRYSRRNRLLNETDNRFWDFSVDELATSDLSAGIDYILQATNRTKLAVVGHSHGAALVLALLASRPERQQNVEVVVALAPAVYLSDLNNATEEPRLVAKQLIQGLAENTSKVAHKMELSTFPELEERLCKPRKEFCEKLYSLLQGTISKESWNNIVKFLPAGTSSSFLEYVNQQLSNGEHLMKHDYGSDSNKNYINGQLEEYDLTKVEVPVHILNSNDDIFISPKDILHLKKQLSNSTYYQIQNDKFNHLDFLWGNETKHVAFIEVVKYLNQYKGEDLSQRSLRIARLDFKLPNLIANNFQYSTTRKNGTVNHSYRIDSSDSVSQISSIFGNNDYNTHWIMSPTLNYSRTWTTSTHTKPEVADLSHPLLSFASRIKEIINLNSKMFFQFINSLRKHRDYIKCEHNIDIEDLKDKAHMDKLKKLLSEIDSKSLNCKGECSKVRDILINIANLKDRTNGADVVSGSSNYDEKEKPTDSQFNDLLNKLQQYKEHIKNNYHIAIGDGNNVHFETIKQLATKVDESKVCIGECKKVKDLLNNIRAFMAHINSTYNLTPSVGASFHKPSSLESLAQTETTQVYNNITEHSTYILHKFKIFVGLLNNEKERQISLKRLYSEIEKLGSNCVGECIQVGSLLVLYFIKDAYHHIVMHETYITNYLNITLLNVNEEKNRWQQLKSLDEKIKTFGTNCVDECSEVRSWLEVYFTSQINYIFLHILAQKTYIEETFDVTLTEVHDQNTRLEKLGELANKVKQLENQCDETCKKLRSFLDRYSMVYEIQSQTQYQPDGGTSGLSRDVNKDVVEGLRQHKDYILKTFHMHLLPFLQDITAVNNLYDRVIQLNDNCVGECKKVLEILVNFKMSSALLKIIDSKTYILNTFNVELSDLDDENRLFKKLNEVILKARNLGIYCYGECETVKYFIKMYILNFEIKQKIGASKPSNQHPISNAHTNIYDLLKRIRQFKEYIGSKFNIELTDGGKDSNFKQISDLSEKIQKLSGHCSGDCRIVLEQLINLEMKLTLAQIYTYRFYILEKFKVLLTDLDNKHDMVQKLKDLENKIKQLGSKCIGECSKVRSLLEAYIIKLKSKEKILGESSIQSPAVPGNLLLTDLVQRMRQYKEYIQRVYSIKFTEADDEKMNFQKIKELSNKIKAMENKCEAECKDILNLLQSYNVEGNSDGLIEDNTGLLSVVSITTGGRSRNGPTSTDYGDLIQRIKDHKKYIENKFNINFNSLDSNIFDINNLETQINRMPDHACTGECKIIRELLKKIQQNQGRITGSIYVGREERFKNFTTTEIIDNYLITSRKTRKYIYEFEKLKQEAARYNQYILNNFNISISDAEDIKTTYQKLSQVLSKLSLTSICTEECKALYNILKDITEYGKYIDEIYQNNILIKELTELINKVSQHYNYIRSTFNIEFSKLEDLVLTYNKLKRLSAQIELTEPCLRECKELKQILAHIGKFEEYIQRTSENVNQIIPDPSNPSNTNFNQNDIGKINDLLQRIREYKEYIKNQFNINVEHIKDKNSDFNQIKSEIDKKGELCTGKCKKVRDIINEIRRYQIHINETFIGGIQWKGIENLLGTEITQDQILKLKELLTKILNHKSFILNTYNIILSESEDITITFGKFKEIWSKITLTKYCTWECQEVKEILQNILEYESNIKSIYIRELPEILKTILQYSGYLKERFNIVISDSEDINTSYKKLKTVWDLISSVDYCTAECQTLKELLKDIRKYEIYFINDISNHPSSDYKKEFYKILTILKKYKIYIENTFHVTISESDEIRTTYYKLQNITAQLATSGYCVKECKELKETLKDIGKFENFINSITDVNVDVLEFNKILKIINKYKFLIRQYFKTTILESDDIEISYRKLTNIMRQLEGIDNCTGVWKDLNEILMDIGKYEKHIRDMSTFQKAKIREFNEIIGKMWTHKDYIYNTFQISISELEDILTTYEKLIKLSTQIYFTDNCGEECQQIKNILENIKDYENYIVTISNKKEERDIISEFTGLVAAINRHKQYIQNRFQVTLPVSEELWTIYEKLRDLWFEVMSTSGCVDECLEIRDLLKDIYKYENYIVYMDTTKVAFVREFAKLIHDVLRYKHYIQTTLHILIPESEDFYTIYEQLNKVCFEISTKAVCKGECKELNTLLKDINKHGYRIQDISYLQKTKITELTEIVAKLMLLNDYIKSSFDIILSETEDISITYEKLTRLWVKISSIADCNEECERIRILLQNIKDYEIYVVKKYNSEEVSNIVGEFTALVKIINQYKRYIKDRFQIIVPDSEDLWTIYVELKKLWTVIRTSSDCVAECLQIRDLLKDVEKYETHLKKVDTEDEASVYIREFTELIQKVMKYKSYIRTTFHIIISDSEDLWTVYDKFKKIWSKIISETYCEGECKELKILLENLEKYENYIENTSSLQDTRNNSAFSERDFANLLKRLKQYKKHVKDTYFWTPEKHADFNTIDNKVKELDKSKVNCDSKCKEAKSVLKQIKMFRNHLAKDYLVNNTHV